MAQQYSIFHLQDFFHTHLVYLIDFFFEVPESVDAFIESIEQKRSFTKTDAILNLKRGHKVLCTYIVHPLSDNDENKKEIELYLENLNKNLSSVEKVKKFKLIKEEFTIENRMLTPTLKLKRKKILEKYKVELEKLY